MSESDKCCTGKQNSEGTIKGLFGGGWVAAFLKSMVLGGLTDKVSLQGRPEALVSTRVVAAEAVFKPLHLRPLHHNTV